MSRLEAIYRELDFLSGDLQTAADFPLMDASAEMWIEKGEWLLAAKKAGADKIFFVNNNPVVVFAEVNNDFDSLYKTYLNIWNLARPRFLFIASPGIVQVFDLHKEPPKFDRRRNNNDLFLETHALEVLYNTESVLDKLSLYHREKFESGQIFGDNRFSSKDFSFRADQSLISDLKFVRSKLIQKGLSGNKIRYAHALIGRSIFIRYLEDREIIDLSYFKKVASNNHDWNNALSSPPSRPGIDLSSRISYYSRVLEDKDFAFALFSQLAEDFNGDMFPDISAERDHITADHLFLIQDLLFGDTGCSFNLLFYAYQFDIIPLDLISSIYEEFYHESNAIEDIKTAKRTSGVFYTPSVLVEFLLSKILTPERMHSKPRILDPACGSGIFLVEAFRRIVRYEHFKNKRAPCYEDFKRILKEQIAGIEVNPEAARIAAFSLYLSILHYMDPPSIMHNLEVGNKLPNLLYCGKSGTNYFNCILPENTFNSKAFDSNTILQDLFRPASFDIIIGNPPWGPVGKNVDDNLRLRDQTMLGWCDSHGYPISDKEQSQAFIWRSINFLKKNGTCGLLVSASILFNQSDTSVTFRKKLFSSISATDVYNFMHVRTIFFKGSISPFIALFFLNSTSNNGTTNYWTAKYTSYASSNQAVFFNLQDYSLLFSDDLSDHRYWKVHSFGRNRDWRFVKHLVNSEIYRPLSCYIIFSSSGFTKGKNGFDTPEWLLSLKKIQTKSFSRYNTLTADDFESTPNRCRAFGHIDLFTGRRIVLKGAPVNSRNENGIIIARYEHKSYAFNDSLNVIKLNKDLDWMYKVLIGILWSSFSRYYLFMTSSKWGRWHDKILASEWATIPVIFDKHNPHTYRLIQIVEQLINYDPTPADVLNPNGIPQYLIDSTRSQYEALLDEIVFDLYHFNQEQRDLITDCCKIIIPFYHNPLKSIGTKQILLDTDIEWLNNSINVFSGIWKSYLDKSEHMSTHVYANSSNTFVAIEFYLSSEKGQTKISKSTTMVTDILSKISKKLKHELGTSSIFLDGQLHIVTKSSIVILKTNEKRLWTRSIARDDAELTLHKVLK